MLTTTEIRAKIDAIPEDHFMSQFKYGCYYGAKGYTPSNCHWKTDQYFSNVENKAWECAYTGDWRSLMNLCTHAMENKHYDLWADWLVHLWDNMITLMVFCGVSVPDDLNLLEWDETLYPKELRADEIFSLQIQACKGDERALTILSHI